MTQLNLPHVATHACACISLTVILRSHGFHSPPRYPAITRAGTPPIRNSVADAAAKCAQKPFFASIKNRGEIEMFFFEKLC